MNIREFLKQLRDNEQKVISIRLPNGDLVPAHYHITEVGHVTKRFIDCGGTRRVLETCLLQTWVHEDLEHRLHAGKLAGIFDRTGDLFPSQDLAVEIEHETDVVAQFPVERAEATADALVLHLGVKHTDCLARGICLPGECAPSPSAVPSPSAAPSIFSPLIPPQTPSFIKLQAGQSACCSPKSGCC